MSDHVALRNEVGRTEAELEYAVERLVAAKADRDAALLAAVRGGLSHEDAGAPAGISAVGVRHILGPATIEEAYDQQHKQQDA